LTRAATAKRDSLEPFKAAGEKATAWTEKYIPDSWVIALILSLITFLMAWIWGSPIGKPWWGADGLFNVMKAWGDGFWILLTFAMQMTLIMLLGYVLAISPPVARFMDWLAKKPNPDRPWQSIGLMGLWSNLTGIVNWGLSISSSAMFLTYIARRQPNVDFRLLVMTAYLGLGITWHAGFSGSATLLMTDPGNFLIKAGIVKDVIPLTRTTFTTFNFALAVLVVALSTLVMIAMTPRAERAVKVGAEKLKAFERWQGPVKPERYKNTAERLNWWPGWNIIVFVLGLAWLAQHFARTGPAGLTLDVLNFIFLLTGIILHFRPARFTAACTEAVRPVWGIIVQFPFYAGIFGMIRFTALAQVMANWFVAVSTPQTFLPLVYWYSGILNYFIPSGGSKWAVEAPYILKAGEAHGISPASVTLTYAWGDMATDIIQPFWAIPLMGVAGVEFRQIMGYGVVLFIIYSIVVTAAMFLMPLKL